MSFGFSGSPLGTDTVHVEVFTVWKLCRTLEIKYDDDDDDDDAADNFEVADDSNEDGASQRPAGS